MSSQVLAAPLTYDAVNADSAYDDVYANAATSA
jgi:hypothetical protein